MICLMINKIQELRDTLGQLETSRIESKVFHDMFSGA